MSKKESTILPTLLITTGLLFFAFIVLVLGIDSMHMRGDENLTFSNMRWGFFESMHVLFNYNNQAPLWWMNTWIWQRIAGDTEWVNRVNSIFYSLLTVSLVYQLGKQWFGKSRYGWAAIAILSVNAYFFIYALEMRMYALVMLTATLCMLLYWRWLSHPSIRRAIAYGLSATLMLYVHYYLAFVVIVQILIFLVYSATAGQEKFKELWIQGVVGGGAALLVWIPGLAILITQLRNIEFVENEGLTISTFPTDAENISYLVNTTTNGWPILYFGIVLAGVWLLRRRFGFWIAVSWAVLAPILVLILNLALTIYTPRYVSFLTPAIGLVIGVPLVMIVEHLLAAQGISTRLKNAVMIAAVGIVGAISLWQLPQHIPNRVPFRIIFDNMEHVAQTGDVILYRNIAPSIPDQARRYFDFDLQAFTKLEDAEEYRRIWFISREFWKPDVREPFEQLQATHRLWHVEGDCTPEWCFLAQLLVAPPSDELLLFGDTVGFLGADIEVLRDENRLQAWLWWEVEQTPTQDYAISLQLLDAEGRLVAQQDRQIQASADDQFIPTSQLQPEQTYLDWRILDLPADWNLEAYNLQLIVYQWQDQTRLTLPDGSDTLSLSLLEAEENMPND